MEQTVLNLNIKHKMEMEQANMYSCEQESKVLNLDKPAKYVELLLKEVEEGKQVFKRLSDATTYIDRLTNMLSDQ